MDKGPRERKSNIERLKDDLYSRKRAPKMDPAARTPLSPGREHAPHSWEDIHEPAPPPPPQEEGFVPHPADPSLLDVRSLPPTVAAKLSTHPDQGNLRPLEAMPITKTKKSGHHLALYFLGGAFVFFLGALGVAAYLFFNGANTISGQNIDLQISAPSIVDSGKPSVIQFTINNRNQESLQAADLVINYPDGTRSAENLTQDLPQERLTIGDIGSGAQIIKTSAAAFFGSEGAPQKISATLEYQLAGSNAIFTKDADTSFTVGSSPVSITASAPDEAISGQSFSFDVTVTSNATAPISNVALQAQFPFGYTLASASPTPDVSGNLWRFGTLAPGASKVVHLTGTLVGSDGDARVFHFLAGSESDLTESSLAVPLLTQAVTVTVHHPFLSGSIAIGGQSGSSAVVPEGHDAQGSVSWQNNLSQDVANAVFTMQISGAFDPGSVTTNGFYDSSKAQIVWNSQTNPELADVAAGGHGNLIFDIGTLSPAQKVLTNPHVDLNLSVTATRAGQGNVPETVASAANMTINLASAVVLSAQALHFTGPFSNTGAMPPTPNTATTYTIVWSVKNPSNDVGNASVSATLPSYIQFISAPQGSGITYDAAKRQVTWTIGDVPIGTGYNSPVTTAAFQISFTPSVNQEGQQPTLTSDAAFVGQDRFAQTSITTTATAPTTRLDSDPQFVQGMEIVK